MATNTSSLRFNGLTRWATLSDNSSLKNKSSFTWMAWVKALSPNFSMNDTSYKRMYVERQGTGVGLRFAATPMQGRMRFELSPKDGKTDTNYDYKVTWDQRWHHVAFVARISGANPTYDIYFDGLPVATGTLVVPSGTTAVTNTAPMGGKIYVGNASFHTSGGDVYADDRYWEGLVDDILIFDGAKNQTEILTYFASHDHWSTTDTDIVSNWRFNENTGTSTTDAIHGTWTGTLANSSTWFADVPFLGNGTLDTTVPATPAVAGTPTTNVSSDAFTANWNSTTDNVAVQGYELHVSLSSSFTSYTTYDVPVTNFFLGVYAYAVEDLLPATNYYWRVRAYDEENNFSSTTATQSLTTSATGDIVPPSPPTGLTSSLITHSTFRVNWTQSPSSDETGYKLDIATDSNFNFYLSEHRNRDVGNVTQFDVTGTNPLTTYYVRLRAYDAAANEGTESTTLVVQTSSLPDLVPPLPIELLLASSIESTAFTANWEEGQDDVGIVRYELDVSIAIDFSSYLTVGATTYNGLNVGHALSYRVTGLQQQKTYYYRVRAVDGAGNESPDVTPASLTTTPSFVDEGGYVQTIFTPTGDAWTDSAATTTNHGTDTSLQVQGNGTIGTRYTHLQFDLAGAVGEIQSAMLNLYVSNASAGTINVIVDNVTFDETTINWSNQPAPGGSIITFVPSTINAWVTIDIGSLFLDGPTVYDIRLTTISSDVFIFDSKEGTHKPYLEVESDPTTATKVDTTMTITDEVITHTNYIKNPSAEDATTTFWTAQGATLSTITATPYSGTRTFQAVCPGSVANEGVYYAKNDIASAIGQNWSTGVALRWISGSKLVRIRLNEYSSGGTLLASTTKNITIDTKWGRYSVQRKTDQATVAFVSIAIETQGTTASTFAWDAAMMWKGEWQAGYFDGDLPGGTWTGTVRASTSTFQTGRFYFETSYTGDSDDDNSVVASFKKSNDDEWIYLDAITATINRTTKRVSTTIGPSYGVYNYLTNPSFETNTTNWTLINPNGNATLTLEPDIRLRGSNSGKLAFGAGTGSGVYSNEVYALPGELWSARVYIFIPIGTTVQLRLRALDSAGAFISATTPVAGESEFSGANRWEEFFVSRVQPASTFTTNFSLVATTASGVFYIDRALLMKGIGPYVDGDMAQGIWEGTAHASFTSYLVGPQKTFQVRHEYSDPDGLTQTLESTYTIAKTHVTIPVPDNVTTGSSLFLFASPESIDVTANYLGDDNNNVTAIIQYKRSDLGTWYQVAPVYNRAGRLITANIDGLNAGVNYTVKVTLSDTDGVIGENPLIQAVTTLTNYGSVTGEPTITFDGFVLMGRSDGKIGVYEHDAFGLPDRRVQIESLPRVDGAIELQNLWDKRSINMKGFVEGDTRGELEDNKNSLKRALAPKQRQLIIDTLSNQNRYYYATCESFAMAEIGGTNIRHLLWDADFVCADPFAYDAALTSVPEFVVVNNTTTTVSNLGDLRVDPYFSIKTSFTKSITFTITNLTTGERITPGTTMKIGDVLVIDTEKCAVTKNGVEVDYAGSFPHLTEGANEFLFTLSSTSGTPTFRASMSWRAKYL